MTNDKVKISVSFNDFTISKDVRWCGDVELRDSLIVKPRKTLLLNMSHTHNKANSKFPLTNLTLKDNASITLMKKSRLVIDEKSTVSLGPACRIYVKKGAKITIKNGGKLEAENSQVIYLKK